MTPSNSIATIPVGAGNPSDQSMEQAICDMYQYGTDALLLYGGYGWVATVTEQHRGVASISDTAAENRESVIFDANNAISNTLSSESDNDSVDHNAISRKRMIC